MGPNATKLHPCRDCCALILHSISGKDYEVWTPTGHPKPGSLSMSHDRLQAHGNKGHN